MNRNTESHFANIPTIGISRSKFDRSFTHKTSWNTGALIPIYCDCTIMPGDTVKMRMSELVRMSTPIVPVMDNANLDTYFFFVPYRLIWDHFKEFFGENNTAPWTQQVEYEIPQIIAPANGGWNEGSLADYLGYRKHVEEYKASALPFRAYCLIWNEFFRSEALQNPMYISTGDADIQGEDGLTLGANYDYVTDTEKGAKPMTACKYFDYFTAALPSAQRGPQVKIPLGATAPVIAGTPSDPISGASVPTAFLGEQVALYRDGQDKMYAINADDNTKGLSPAPATISLETDLSNATAATINQLRQAFAIQKFYERQARGGTRYIELIKSHYDVTNPDFRVQRPEYLGGERIPINMNQVVQSSESGTTPQGTTGAYSLTSNVNEDLFTHSFTEHGILMGLAVVRTVHTYQQGLNKQYSKKKFTDFYFPEFANLGEEAILNKEIYLQGPTVVDADGNVIDEQAFGYQERWASERMMPDIITGELNSDYAQSLDYWHYGDDYSQLPSLGDEWIQESAMNVQRTLAVDGHHQLIGDFYFGAIYTRPMPLYSVPGLIDHH